VERLQSTQHRFEQGSILEKYCRNAIRNLENLIDHYPVEEMKRIAQVISDAEAVYVTAYRASATLAHHFGYLLKKVRGGVFVDTHLSWELIDALYTAPPGALLFAIAFPRYPRKTIELIEYARKCGVRVIGLSDNPRSPIVTAADLQLVVDIEGVSFIDPFAHVITFLGALVHEITACGSERALNGLSSFDRGVRAANEFYSESVPYERLEYQLEGPRVTSLWPQKESDKT
jgi:DNA-binding MurR/RpiR family transcriptional regulator